MEQVVSCIQGNCTERSHGVLMVLTSWTMSDTPIIETHPPSDPSSSSSGATKSTDKAKECKLYGIGEECASGFIEWGVDVQDLLRTTTGGRPPYEYLLVRFLPGVFVSVV